MDEPSQVMTCIQQDFRWDRVDERNVYLARLVRDLELPTAQIVTQLFAHPEDADGYPFETALEVLEVLGRVGVDGVADELRRYVAEGDGWKTVLEEIARSWPVEWWDDLYPVAQARWDEDSEEPLWRSMPWVRWADRDERWASEIRKFPRPPAPRPFEDWSMSALVELLRRGGPQQAVIGELRRRPPDPLLLEVADHVTAPSFGAQVKRLGAAALPLARRWAATSEHPRRWTALRLIAAHGDGTDVPRLLEGVDWLDEQEDLCGYKDLVDGLVRIGGPLAAGILPRVRRLWVSPHSYERAAYLDALIRLDPAGLPQELLEGLWDCESDVRYLSVRHVPLSGAIRERLLYLRDDPMERADIREAAAERLV